MSRLATGLRPRVRVHSTMPLSPVQLGPGLRVIQDNSVGAAGPKARFSHCPVSYFDIAKLRSKGPRPAADVGSPHDSTRKLVDLGSQSAGAWWCAEGGWPSPKPKVITEVFYVLSGHGCVTDADGTRHFMGPGDLVVLPKGHTGRWDVLEDFHKVWVNTDHPDIGRKPTAVVAPYSSFAPHHLESHGLHSDAIPLSVANSPVTASRDVYENQHMQVGISTITPGSFTISNGPNTSKCFLVLEGVFFLSGADGSGQRCVAGDTVCLPKNWSGTVDVIETVKKIHVNRM
mmetsp:Transcript_3138/g.5841  ORF Transcript_3138/g.5841 Transcript_3138/m.5841 type:complete len:287 (-) Transcript_3138:213-1073(-)|eukprot:CAMPEP_0197526722 /NCGR_PEP_ID=MMETSP1318-20131121/19040_1 /TAXON_ID=552666 /ORGANISM="Partenskyella glossopodia, Strain RCC365" /LENGTH=286 /DNA_ID=CAMNT_0043081017 /DNA_START=49 /DNA_END=909 /DNA_ORIENTATION=-